MYKLLKDDISGSLVCIKRSDGWFIPFDPANTDYQRFKQEINADEAQLQDVDGNVMSADAAKAFVAGLP